MYAPASPSINKLNKFSIIKIVIIKKKQLIKFLSIVNPFIKSNLNKIKITDVIFSINKPFKPSMKFAPFIKINKQNEVKNILKIQFCKKLSKKINLDVAISKFKKITQQKTMII